MHIATARLHTIWQSHAGELYTRWMYNSAIDLQATGSGLRDERNIKAYFISYGPWPQAHANRINLWFFLFFFFSI